MTLLPEFETSFSAPASALEGKRVGMVTFSPYPADPRPRRVIDALRREGLLIDLVCLSGEGLPARESLDGINVLRIPIVHRRKSKLAYVWNYFAFIFISTFILAFRSIKRRYDLIYIHNMPDILVLSSLIPKALGARVILDLHDPMPELMMTIFKLEKGHPAVRFISWLEKWSIARAHTALTVNSACKRAFASRSCSPDKIRVVMNSPDEKIIPFKPARPFPSATNIASEPFVIMYHGSALERNGLDVAVDALFRVRKILPTAELRIFGRETPFLREVLNKARNYGMDDCVRFMGPVQLEDLVPEIESCHMGVVPNQRNPFTNINTPTRIFEYLSIGKPVVAPRTPGVLDYFNAESLFYFEPGDVDELARRIEYVAFHYNEAVERVRRGQHILLKHTWFQESRVLVEAVQNLLSDERR